MQAPRRIVSTEVSRSENSITPHFSPPQPQPAPPCSACTSVESARASVGRFLTCVTQGLIKPCKAAVEGRPPSHPECAQSVW